jgi:acetylornithine deacetylase/succinyl-diaminopimelate desuccinylase-like protein
MVTSNLWLFGPLFTARLASDRTTAPTVRTTTAVTVVEGGHADNVMPAVATAYVNHRVHPLDTVADVIAHDVKVRCARAGYVPGLCWHCDVHVLAGFSCAKRGARRGWGVCVRNVWRVGGG